MNNLIVAEITTENYNNIFISLTLDGMKGNHSSKQMFCCWISHAIVDKTLIFLPGWKVCQLRTECQVTDKILRTKNEINVRTKIKIEIARDGPIPIFYDNVL